MRRVLLLACCACTTRHAPARNSDPAPQSAAVAAHASPPWPTKAEPTAPRGLHWATLHHETIHARLLVPDGVTPVLTHDVNGYPLVTIAVAGERLDCQFDSGLGPPTQTLRRDPPTFYGMHVDDHLVTPETIAVRYRDSQGDARVAGYAPGVKCKFESYREMPPAILEQLYAICASVRSPTPGPWRAATDAERSNGGMTDVPDGAWVEPSLPTTAGSLLRPGKFIARMHVNELTITSVPCPAPIEDERKPQKPEVAVSLEQRSNAWIRTATEEYENVRYPGLTVVWRPAGQRCCFAEFVPWIDPPESAKIDYAIALCGTFRE